MACLFLCLFPFLPFSSNVSVSILIPPHLCLPLWHYSLFTAKCHVLPIYTLRSCMLYPRGFLGSLSNLRISPYTEIFFMSASLVNSDFPLWWAIPFLQCLTTSAMSFGLLRCFAVSFFHWLSLSVLFSTA